eukprot:60668-Pleurochrysis_carterae.AAC.1
MRASVRLQTSYACECVRVSTTRTTQALHSASPAMPLPKPPNHLVCAFDCMRECDEVRTRACVRKRVCLLYPMCMC